MPFSGIGYDPSFLLGFRRSCSTVDQAANCGASPRYSLAALGSVFRTPSTCWPFQSYRSTLYCIKAPIIARRITMGRTEDARNESVSSTLDTGYILRQVHLNLGPRLEVMHGAVYV